MAFTSKYLRKIVFLQTAVFEKKDLSEAGSLTFQGHPD
jgi:hypothetical protein